MAEKKVMIIAGEPSGDLHAASLVRELKTLNRGLTFFGMGGKRMEEEGVEILQGIEDLALVGFLEVIRHLRKVRNVLSNLRRSLKELNPDIVLLVDYPGFNLRFARHAKLDGFKVLYFITPQVWAWGKWRIQQMKRWVNRAIVIFPFEEKLYRENGIPTTFVGHPSLDLVESELTRTELCQSLNLPHDQPLIGILPGSRKGEVKRMLPLMIQCARRIQSQINSSFVVPLALGIEPGDILNSNHPSLEKHPNMRVVNGKTYDVMKNADLLLIASGTATLEATLFKTPMLILYKLSPFSYWIAKRFVKIENYGLVNIVAEKKIVPEFIQFKARPSLVVPEAISLLTDNKRREKMREYLNMVKEKLGKPGAAKKAAEAVLVEL
jgi:lipid-A-disaccharide synthase